ncbi:MAG: hypothetical protein RLY87_1462 [Chloroflexota bacterium]|jgi:uncharacterized protein YdhG (YjbR/CyaY superfamily)
MSTKKADGFSAAEKAAMAERARELKAEAKSNQLRADGEKDLRAKIADFPPHEQEMALRLHELVSTHAPMLSPKTWYGMPAWTRDGKVVCFFQNGSKFGVRYNTLGFQDAATLDDSPMWPTSYALLALTPEIEERIIALLKKATK